MPDRRRAWAAALLEAAPDAERRAAYGDALDAIALVMGERGALRDFLRDPGVPKAEKAAALASAASPARAGGADPLFLRFCALLVDTGRAELLPAIAAAYRRSLDRVEGVAPLEVEAAREVPPATLQRLSEAWAGATGASSVRVSVRVAPELIAGYRLRSGSIRLDYTVAGRASRLGRALARSQGRRLDGSATGGSARGEG